MTQLDFALGGTYPFGIMVGDILSPLFYVEYNTTTTAAAAKSNGITYMYLFVSGYRCEGHASECHVPKSRNEMTTRAVKLMACKVDLAS